MSLLILVVSCAGPATAPQDTASTTPLQGEALTALTAWVPDEDDLFAQERPEAVDCPDWSYGEELGTFEVNTDICNYGAFEQALLDDVSAGETLKLDWWHDALWSEDSTAQAHVAMGLADEVLYEQAVPIPADLTVYRLSLLPKFDHPAGTSAWLHVHNHGANTYNFGVLSR